MKANLVFPKQVSRTVGVIDTNLGLDHALALRSGFEVHYLPDGCGAYPQIQNQASGDGFEGINKLGDVGGALSKDIIFITDCFLGQLADEERARGKAVFGASGEWTRIENDRVHGWNALKGMGVGVPDGVVVRGIGQLLKFIKENQGSQKSYFTNLKTRRGLVMMMVSPEEDRQFKTGDDLVCYAKSLPIKQAQPENRVFFIKVSQYRGNRETGSVMNVTEALVSLSQAGFGPYLTDLEILIQFMCPGVEIGFDAFFNGRDFVRPFLYTIEVKGQGTIGVWVERNGIEDLIFDRIKPSLISTGYRGNISFEFFWDGVKVRAHDPTARLPFPCSSIQAHFIRNAPEVYEKVARGEDVRVEVDDPYAAQIGVYTDDIDTWRVIRYDDQLRDKVGFRRACMRGRDCYLVPGDQVVATALGGGASPKAAMDDAVNTANHIECSNSSFPAHFIDEIGNIIDRLNSLEGDMKF